MFAQHINLTSYKTVLVHYALLLKTGWFRIKAVLLVSKVTLLTKLNKNVFVRMRLLIRLVWYVLLLLIGILLLKIVVLALRILIMMFLRVSVFVVLKDINSIRLN